MPLAENDLDLLRRFIDGGDADAFAGLVRRHSGLVYHTCLRVLGDRPRAEDATQETFHRLMRNPEKVNHSLAAWLHRVATRCSIDILRSDTARRKRELAYQQRIENRRQPAEPWASVSGHIDEALAKLNPSERELLVEHFLNGKTQAEIARANGVSKATLSRRTQAALNTLRQHLGKTVAGGLAAALTGLSAQASAGVPATLSTELGKMALVSGHTIAPAAIGVQLGSMSFKLITVAWIGGLLGTAAIGLLAMAIMSLSADPPHRSTTLESAAAVQHAVGSTGEAESIPDATDLIYLRPPGESLRSDHVLAYSIEGDTVSVVFADSHVRSMSLELARPMIEEQAGMTLEQLAAQTFTQPSAQP
ncbi:MAG: sigma-70 family RNA polymerase sigma factor [Planctomycetota bacterium]